MRHTCPRTGPALDPRRAWRCGEVGGGVVDPAGRVSTLRPRPATLAGTMRSPGDPLSMPETCCDECITKVDEGVGRRHVRRRRAGLAGRRGRLARTLRGSGRWIVGRRRRRVDERLVGGFQRRLQRWFVWIIGGRLVRLVGRILRELGLRRGQFRRHDPTRGAPGAAGLAARLVGRILGLVRRLFGRIIRRIVRFVGRFLRLVRIVRQLVMRDAGRGRRADRSARVGCVGDIRAVRMDSAPGCPAARRPTNVDSSRRHGAGDHRCVCCWR